MQSMHCASVDSLRVSWRLPPGLGGACECVNLRKCLGLALNALFFGTFDANRHCQLSMQLCWVGFYWDLLMDGFDRYKKL